MMAGARTPNVIFIMPAGPAPECTPYLDCPQCPRSPTLGQVYRKTHSKWPPPGPLVYLVLRASQDAYLRTLCQIVCPRKFMSISDNWGGLVDCLGSVMRNLVCHQKTNHVYQIRSYIWSPCIAVLIILRSCWLQALQ